MELIRHILNTVIYWNEPYILYNFAYGLIQYAVTWILIYILYKFVVNDPPFVIGRYRPKRLIAENQNPEK